MLIKLRKLMFQQTEKEENELQIYRILFQVNVYLY
jgi:hypothetical protein